MHLVYNYNTLSAKKQYETDANSNVFAVVGSFLHLKFYTRFIPILSNLSNVYKNYLSVVFYLSCDNLNEIYTIVYDKEENKIVSISDLVKEKPSILSILSTKSRKILANNKNIKKLSLMMKGTEEIEDNFLHFVFAPTGIMLYFSSGQVTDKEYGIIKVVVPYEDIKKDSN